MPNLASILREEIRRLARKELRSDLSGTKRATAQYRREIAALKRQLAGHARKLAFLERQEKQRIAKKPQPVDSEGVRFSPKWLKAHRTKLGFSAAQYGKLVGVTALSIYNWEQGKSKPRPKQLAAWAAIRGLGKRSALRHIEMLDKAR